MSTENNKFKTVILSESYGNCDKEKLHTESTAKDFIIENELLGYTLIAKEYYEERLYMLASKKAILNGQLRFLNNEIAITEEKLKAIKEGKIDGRKEIT